MGVAHTLIPALYPHPRHALFGKVELMPMCHSALIMTRASCDTVLGNAFTMTHARRKNGEHIIEYD